jgi:glycosyltransferase involved in cell wall biosynthesis
MRGGEKCLEAACALWPDADVFTLIHRRGAVSPAIERHRITTSFLQRIPRIDRIYRHLLPLFPMAIERFDFTGYDRVVSFSHCVAKGAIPPPGTEHSSYCFSPMRYVWDLYGDYFGRRRGIPAFAISAFSTWLRMWDVSATARVDRIAAISRHVQQRVLRYYRRESTVLYPPVEDVYFERPLPEAPGEYWLVLGAFAPYKRIEIAIEAARRAGEALWVVGDGPENRRLRAMAPSSVRFLGWQPAERLPEIYAGARALLFPGIEDFGISPLECQAMGRPVIGYAAGGLLETVLPLGRDGQSPTGVLYDDPTVEGLVEALGTFGRRERDFDPAALRRHAAAFRRDRFLAELGGFVEGARRC